MAGDALTIGLDGPGSVEMLADQDPTPGIAFAFWTWRDINEEATETDRVVISYGGLVSEADQKVTLSGCYFPEGRTGLSRFFGES